METLLQTNSDRSSNCNNQENQSITSPISFYGTAEEFYYDESNSSVNNSNTCNGNLSNRVNSSCEKKQSKNGILELGKKQISTLPIPGLIQKNNQKKSFWLYFVIILLVVLIILFNVVMIIIFIAYQNQIYQRQSNKEYYYQMMYYNAKENNSLITGEIVEKKRIRGFSFSDSKGAGYIYELSFGEENENENEYEINGKCSCCVECIEDDNCKDNQICDNNICVDCLKDYDCEEEGVVCYNGKCVIRDSIFCQRDEECKRERGEICKMGGCERGCRSDYDCKISLGEICLESKCNIHGCKDNFDCNEYDSICLDNECVNIDENTIPCLDDSDCPDKDELCNYEYLICVKIKTNDVVKKRVVPVAVCSIYGTMVLYIMASSYTIASNLANTKLLNECSEKCKYLSTSIQYSEIRDIYITLKKRTVKRKRKDSECSGRCRVNGRITNPTTLEYSGELCPKKKLTYLVEMDKKADYVNGGYFSSAIASDIFKTMLSLYCKEFTYGYFARKGSDWIESSICVADRQSIHCSSL